MGVSVFKAIRSPIAKFIYFLLASAFFIGFGILTSINPGPQIGEIEFGGKKIRADELYLIMRDMGDAEDKKIEEFFDLMIARKVISLEMERWGFKIGSEDLISLFSAPLGIRTRADYLNLIRSSGATRESFENYLKDTYLFNKFQDIIVRAIMAGEMNDFQDFVSRFAGSRRLSIVEVDKTKFSVKISPEKLKNYYIINRSEFRIPESREFWVAKFSSSVTAQVFYEKNVGRRFEDFSVFSREATEAGGNPTSFIMGKRQGVANVAFAPLFSEVITEGSISPPQQVGDEWWVVYINRIEPERIPPLEEVEGKVREKVYALEVKKILEKILKDKKFRSKEGFEDFFHKYGKIYRETVPLLAEFYPQLGNQPELSDYLLSDEENFAVDKVFTKDDKLFVVFVGELLHAPPSKTAEILNLDAQRIIEGFVSSRMMDIQMKPRSRDEAIKKLTRAD